MVKQSPLSSPPLHWQRIEIRRFQIFEHLLLERTDANVDRGQWTLLIGENGVGKTTFLKSIALAMMSIFDRGALSPATNSNPSIQVHFAGGPRLAVHPARPSQSAGGPAESPDFQEPWWAYSTQRGTALGGPSREVDLDPRAAARSLFDRDWRLIHAETWLQSRHYAALHDGGKAADFFQAICATLRAVLPDVEDIEVRPEAVVLKRSGEEPLPLRSFSDGYLTTAGWIIDLIARWAERARALHLEVGADFRKEMTGMVLVDEIDLHLHPAWQTRIVRDLRDLFPKLSFVATTHNPLTLLGAEKGEIFVLRRNADGAVEGIQRDLPPGIDVDQVLTGDWFGLSSTLDSDTLLLLNRHREMLRAGTVPDDPARRGLEAELRRRLGIFGDTSVDRMVQSVAAELMPTAPTELGPEERAALREKILEVASKKLG